MKLQDKVIVVSGAAPEIGRRIALVSADHVLKVVIADLTESGTQETAKTIKTTDGEAVFVKVNVAEEDDAQKLIEPAMEYFGALHGAVNNASLAGEQVYFIETSNDVTTTAFLDSAPEYKMQEFEWMQAGGTSQGRRRNG